MQARNVADGATSLDYLAFASQLVEVKSCWQPAQGMVAIITRKRCCLHLLPDSSRSHRVKAYFSAYSA
jgi:hypothetical protein